MLSRKNKIKKEEIPQITRFGRIFYGNFVTLRIKDFVFEKENPFLPQNQASVVISKTSIKKATERNLWKRRVYSVIQKSEILKNKNLKIIVFIKKEIKNAGFSDIKNDLENLFSKLA